MTRFGSHIDISSFETIKPGLLAANIFAHPSRQSMGQNLSGKGALVFEGELLEAPLTWHPKGTGN
ncbi:MAG: hypothetical protein L3J32_13015 [Rhizobiaceae bacterium]|nr:hypothetical protein [Rhizobiaceae bacterium]